MPRKITNILSDSGDLVALTEDGTLWRLVELEETDPDTNEPIEAWEAMPEIPTDEEIKAAMPPPEEGAPDAEVPRETSEQHGDEAAPAT